MEHAEVLGFIESYRLAGKGPGYVDMHLLSSAMRSGARLWRLDRKLSDVSSSLRIAY